MKKLLPIIVSAAILLASVLPTVASATTVYHQRTLKTTGVQNAPVVSVYIDTAKKLKALEGENAPETAIFTVNKSLKAVIEGKSYTVKELYSKCGEGVLPLFYTEGAYLTPLYEYLTDNKLDDVIIGSNDADALRAVEQSKTVHKAYFSDIVSETNTKEEILKKIRTANAGLLFIPEDSLKRSTVEYFRKRLVEVYINNGTDGAILENVMCLGADGVVTDNAENTYSELSKTIEKTYYKRFFISAHRGYNKAAPENSVEAMRLARDGGADYIELDVLSTADGELVVHHNTSVGVDINSMRANGLSIELPSKEIFELTLSDLKKIILPPVGNYKSCRIPTLEEYLKAFTEEESDAVLLLEMKSYDDETCSKTSDLLEKYGVSLDTVILSFEFNIAEKFSELNFKVGKMILTSWYSLTRYEGKQEERIEQLLKTLAVNKCEGISTTADCMTAEDVRLFAARGITVNMWTVNDISLMEELYDRGVSSVTSDIAEDVISAKAFALKLSASYLKEPLPISKTEKETLAKEKAKETELSASQGGNSAENDKGDGGIFATESEMTVSEAKEIIRKNKTNTASTFDGAETGRYEKSVTAALIILLTVSVTSAGLLAALQFKKHKRR